MNRTIAPLATALVVLLLSCLSLDAQSTMGPATKVKASENYVIVPLDVIQFKILGEAETESEVRVANDGSISLPYIGHVTISGMSVADARKMIFEKYAADYYVNPQIDLSIISYKQQRVNVQGMVNRQGFIIFPPEEKVTLLGAIAMSGGWSDNRLASKTVKLVRSTEKGTTTTEIDTTKIGPDDCLLQDGDLIIVPERTW